MAQLEAAYQNRLELPTPQLRSGDDGDYYVIPCVVHVVWGVAANGADSIPLSQVLNQFQVLFNDFRNVPGSRGYNDIGTDTRIEFNLATLDPAGDPTQGVVWHYDPPLASHNMATESLTLKSTYFWPRNKYFNIYVVNDFSGASILGYANFPGTTATADDGIVIAREYFGTGPGTSSPYNQGRTGTHEIGHWLSLFHTFEGGCGTTNCSSSGDRVCDTPPTREANYGSAGARQNTCSTDQPDRPDNVRNYMDYMNDNDLNYFSRGQTLRMWSVLDNTAAIQRNPLWQANNLAATGTGPYKAPIAHFVAHRRTVCLGAQVRFTDYSRHVPTSWQWSFPGGTPATSTQQNPVVTYAAAGTYDVQLIVNNTSNTPDTLVMTDYITVVDDVRPLPFSEGFDAAATFPTGWEVGNPDSAVTSISRRWDLSAQASGFGQSMRAARMNTGNYYTYEALDHLTTPSLDLSADTVARLRFSVASAPLFQNASGNNLALLYSDTLEVNVSDDCGFTWTTVYRKGGQQLSYNGSFLSSQWGSPTASQWRRDTVSLTAFAGQPNVQVRFTVKNGAGNSLFLDDVTVEPLSYTPVVTASAEASPFETPVAAVPNPLGTHTQLLFTLSSAQDVHIEVQDVHGRSLLHQCVGTLQAGAQRVGLNLEQLPAGLYLCRIQAGAHTHTVRVLKQ
jgi:PKD repeat protein